MGMSFVEHYCSKKEKSYVFLFKNNPDCNDHNTDQNACCSHEHNKECCKNIKHHKKFDFESTVRLSEQLISQTIISKVNLIIFEPFRYLSYSLPLFLNELSLFFLRIKSVTELRI